MAAIPALTASQRVRLTLCVQARRWVPASSSRATSGAPQKTPIAAGTASRIGPISCLSTSSWARNAAPAPPQPTVAARLARPLA